MHIERNPVPAFRQIYRLLVAFGCIHLHGVGDGAHSGLLSESDFLWIRTQHHRLACCIVPQLERQRACHRRAVVDGHVEHAASCVGIILDVVHTHAASCRVEGSHHVLRLRDDAVAHIDLSHDVHRVALQVLVNPPFRTLTLDSQYDRQWFRQPVLVSQVDDLVVSAHIDVLADGDVNIVGAHGIHHVAGLVSRHPARQVLDGVGVRLAALVDNLQEELTLVARLHTCRDALVAPLQWVAVHEEALSGRRLHEVTVLVRDVVERHIHILLVDA